MIAASASVNRYTANGVTVAFVYSFEILSSADIAVYVDDVLKTLATHYTVSGVGASGGGSVTFLTAPSNNAKVTLMLNQPVSQLTNYIANESYSPLRVMSDLDKTTNIHKMHAEQLLRAVKMGRSSTHTDMVMPEPEAAKYLRWNNDGDALENVELVADGEIVISDETPETIGSDEAGPGTSGDAARSDHVHEVDRGIFVSVKMFGAVGDGVADDTLAINAAIAAASGEVWFPKGIYKITETITISGHNVVLRGVGRGEIQQDASQVHTTGTCILWGGDTGGTMIAMAPSSGAGNHRLADGGIESMFLDGDQEAAVGLDLKSLNNCTFRGLAFHGITQWAIKTGVITTLAAPRDLQHCTFDDLWIDAGNQTETEAGGVILDGDATANTSFNCFVNLTFPIFDGIAIDAKNCDNNSFITTHIQHGGTTGQALILRGSGSSAALTARNNFFFDFEPHTAAVTSEAGAHPAVDNVIYGYSLGNGAALPTVAAGSRLFFQTERFSSQYGSKGFTIVNDLADAATELAAQVSGGDGLRIKNAAENHLILKNASVGWSVALVTATGNFRIAPVVGNPNGFELASDVIRNGLKILGARQTGWTAATGNATRSTFATGSVTTEQLAERVKALLDDLISHGIIGA